MYLIHVYSNANVKTIIYYGRKNLWIRWGLRSDLIGIFQQINLKLTHFYTVYIVQLIWYLLNAFIPWKTNIACRMRFTIAILKGREPWLQNSHFTFFLPEKPRTVEFIYSQQSPVLITSEEYKLRLIFFSASWLLLRL